MVKNRPSTRVRLRQRLGTSFQTFLDGPTCGRLEDDSQGVRDDGDGRAER